MPYDSRALVPLNTVGSFTVWQYRTTDSRAAVISPGYFSDITPRLRSGHLLILQSADAMSFLPIGASGVVGADLTVETKPISLNITHSVSLQFSAGGKITAVLRQIKLDAVPDPLRVGDTLVVGATVEGAVREVRFTVMNSSGAIVSGPVAAFVVAGRVKATLTTPRAGDGYYVRVVDVEDPRLAKRTAFFTIIRSTPVTSMAGLLTEGGGRLLLES